MVEVSGVSSDGTGGDEDSHAAGRAFRLPLQAGGTGQDGGLVAALSPVHLRMASVGPPVLHVVHSGTRSGAGRHRKHARPPRANGSGDLAVEERVAGHVRDPACPGARLRDTDGDTKRHRVPRPESPPAARRHVTELTVAQCEDHRVWVGPPRQGRATPTACSMTAGAAPSAGQRDPPEPRRVAVVRCDVGSGDPGCEQHRCRTHHRDDRGPKRSHGLPQAGLARGGTDPSRRKGRMVSSSLRGWP